MSPLQAVPRLPIVGVMGSHSAAWAEYARPLGAHLAARGVHLLTGGGTGAMAAVAEGFCAVAPRRGLSIGILPAVADPVRGFVPMEGYPNPWVEVPIVTPLGTFRGADDNVITRNHINVLTAAAVVALPGQTGTHNEIRLARRFGRKIVLFGPASEFTAYGHALPQAETLGKVVAFLDSVLNA